jgi:hypothetical protein
LSSHFKSSLFVRFANRRLVFDDAENMNLALGYAEYDGIPVM